MSPAAWKPGKNGQAPLLLTTWWWEALHHHCYDLNFTGKESGQRPQGTTSRSESPRWYLVIKHLDWTLKRGGFDHHDHLIFTALEPPSSGFTRSIQGQGIADDKEHDDIHEPIAEGDLPTGVPRDAEGWQNSPWLLYIEYLFVCLYVCVCVYIYINRYVHILYARTTYSTHMEVSLK